jgi:hypothetical protein
MRYTPTHRAETGFDTWMRSTRLIRRIGAFTLACGVIVSTNNPFPAKQELPVIKQTFEEQLTQVTHRYPELDKLATTLSDGSSLFPVKVRCGDLEPTSTIGLVFPDSQHEGSIAPTHQVADTIYLDKNIVCDPLIQMIQNPSHTESAEPLADLLHEQQHVMGVTSEAAATCRATQELPITLQRLGYSKSASAVLAKSYASTVYYYQNEEYRSEECRDNGELDINVPHSLAIFPTQLKDIP